MITDLLTEDCVLSVSCPIITMYVFDSILLPRFTVIHMLYSVMFLFSDLYLCTVGN